MANTVEDKVKKESNSNGQGEETFDLETREWMEALEYIMAEQGPDRTRELLENLIEAARLAGVPIPFTANTPYINTIPKHMEPEYPGDREIERRIKSVVRWNAMAMVVKANNVKDEKGEKVQGIGGHISTFASSATLYEVGFNHFFRGRTKDFPGDFIFFQGHASPGMYSRAYLEGRLPASKLHNFRRELADGGGLSSYPHPWLMPDFWQFPTVSMGLGPILSIYQARFNRYLMDRGIAKQNESRVWAFLGDGECDEPETLGAITLASREKLDNLIWVINCNLQRLDGPVRGNGKIIQELEATFRGAGWNVVKVVWGENWDELLEKDSKGILKKRMMEVLDGEYQKFSVEGGAYNREHFFGKYPELKEMVANMSDDDIRNLRRGGLDPQKVFTAYHNAVNTEGRPTVILAKTVKGYGLGELGEGRNIAHNQKGDKVQRAELVAFRDRFNIPVSDDEIDDLPFYKFPKNSPEQKYIEERRKALGGHVPARVVESKPLDVPGRDYFAPVIEKMNGNIASTTMTFANAILPALLRHKEIGKFIVPIIPDEARTFGMDGLFAQVGIYSHIGQLYEPVDRKMVAYYKESTNGQILEEGINEAGAMSSFIAAGTSYASHGIPMIPFYTYYSMFGFQRVGDLAWLAGDIRARGFLMGGTAGRTTLNGEGLQHQDGHNTLIASTIPNCQVYHPAYGFEIATIIQDGLRRMYGEEEDIYYYITIGNENYEQFPMPEGVEEGILKGLYKLKPGNGEGKLKAHIWGDFSAINAALEAQEILARDYNVDADVWSATNYKLLREDCMTVDRWNALHPTAKKKKSSYLENLLAQEKGVFIAVSEQMRSVPDQVAKWVPGGLFTLGCDGYGRSESREELRNFYETDAKHTVVAVLHQLAAKGEIKPAVVEKAIKALGIDADQEFSLYR